jgi:hypothetical protein
MLYFVIVCAFFSTSSNYRTCPIMLCVLPFLVHSILPTLCDLNICTYICPDKWNTFRKDFFCCQLCQLILPAGVWEMARSGILITDKISFESSEPSCFTIPGWTRPSRRGPRRKPRSRRSPRRPPQSRPPDRALKLILFFLKATTLYPGGVQSHNL